MTERPVAGQNRVLWPWLMMGIVVLALILWWLLGRDRSASPVVDATTDSTQVRDANAATSMAAVSEFERFVGADPEASSSHDYTADGLRKLAAGLEAVAPSGSVAGMDVGMRANEIRVRADSIQRDPSSTTHARQAREGALLAASVLQQIQEARFAALSEQARRVTDAAKALKADQPLLDQTTQVKTFFTSAASALRAMTPPA